MREVKKGMLIGVGVGPGDPELLTIKAQRALRNADIIAVPERAGGEATAYGIVREHIGDKPVMHCPAPMTKDSAVLEENYDSVAENISAELDSGKTVAFVTLGDPTVYSTYMYIHQRVMSRGYDTCIIPGITSFCAAAARLQESLCERDERLLIVPASYDCEDVYGFRANKVFMKAGRDAAALADELKGRGLLKNAFAVENCGMDSERIWRDMSGYEGSGYYSLVVVKEE